MSKYDKAKITISAVSKLKPGEILMDTEQPGFGVRRQSNATVFFVRKHVRGKRHYETIGEVGTGGLTVAVAREKASRIISGLREGISPMERRTRERGMPTLINLADEWLSAHVDAKLKPKTADDYRTSLKRHILPVLGKLRIDQIDEALVAGMHHRARATPYAANRAVAVLSKMMSYAERQGYRQKGTNPATGLERYREQKRERYLSVEELARLGQALNAQDVNDRHWPFAIAAIRFLALTGMRRNEVLKLRWEEVDLDRGMLNLRDTKTGKSSIQLGNDAVAFLLSLPKFSDVWVFPGITLDKPMYDVKKAWNTVVKKAGLGNVRIHDLRHTFASVAAGSGASLPMIGGLLGHAQPATTQRYAHLAASPLQEMADRTASSIAMAMGSPSVK